MDSHHNPQVATELNIFIDGLIDQKFAQHKNELTPEVREELRRDIFQRLDEFIMARVIAALSDDDVQQLEQLLQAGKSRQDVQQFAAEKIPDFATFVTDALLEFRSVYLETS